MTIIYKPLVWLRNVIKTPPFSAAARLEAGLLLRRLQMGELIAMPHSRPMPTIGKSCHELRIVDAGKTWRIMYCIHPQAIVILHIFTKTTAQTPNDAINLSKQRLAEFTSIADN